MQIEHLEIRKMVKKAAIKKKYIPNSKEKYMCAKHKKFFTEELLKWKSDIIKANNLGNLLNSLRNQTYNNWRILFIDGKSNQEHRKFE